MSPQRKPPPELDQNVDTVLGYDPSKADVDEDPIAVESWSVPVTEIFSHAGVRLDATHFNPQTAKIIDALRKFGVDLDPLSRLATVELRSQFARIWATDRKHGVPYLNATDLLSLLSLGVPSGGTRYLSHATKTNIDNLIVREGWLLMTCSGTIGRVFYVPKRLDGWAATHDLIRIVPNEASMTGYLYAWLGTPAAQAQILSHTHGGQVDHVTDDQVAGVLVPRLPSDEVNRINADVIKALRTREKAIAALIRAWPES